MIRSPNRRRIRYIAQGNNGWVKEKAPGRDEMALSVIKRGIVAPGGGWVGANKGPKKLCKGNVSIGPTCGVNERKGRGADKMGRAKRALCKDEPHQVGEIFYDIGRHQE